MVVMYTCYVLRAVATQHYSSRAAYWLPFRRNEPFPKALLLVKFRTSLDVKRTPQKVLIAMQVFEMNTIGNLHALYSDLGNDLGIG